MGVMVSHITSLTIVYSTVNSGANQSKHQSSASLAFVWGIHRWPVNSTHKWSVTRDMIPFDDVIMLEWYDLHDDVMAWKRISGFVSEGVDCWIPVTKSQLCRALIFSLMLALTSCRTINWVAGGPRLCGAHMVSFQSNISTNWGWIKSASNFVEEISKCILWNEVLLFCFKHHRSLFTRVQLTLKPRSHMYCNLSATALRLKNSCNQCNHCAIKNCIFRLQINRRLVGDNCP